MNATVRRISIWIMSPARPALLGLAILGAASAGDAAAGPIHLHALGTPEKGETTAEYFGRMLAEHVTKITEAELRAGRRTLHAESTGLLPDTTFVEYMRWRQGLAVERFDANHPIIAAMLRKDASVRALQVSPEQLASSPPLAVPPPEVSAQTLTPPSIVSPPYIPPPNVPEPGTALMAVALIGSAAFARRWARRQA